MRINCQIVLKSPLTLLVVSAPGTSSSFSADNYEVRLCFEKLTDVHFTTCRPPPAWYPSSNEQNLVGKFLRIEK